MTMTTTQEVKGKQQMRLRKLRLIHDKKNTIHSNLFTLSLFVRTFSSLLIYPFVCSFILLFLFLLISHRRHVCVEHKTSLMPITDRQTDRKEIALPCNDDKYCKNSK